MNNRQTDDTIFNEALQLLRRMESPVSVDVTDKVMARVATMPLLSPVSARPALRWRGVASIAAFFAAASVALFLVLRSAPSDASVGAMLSDVYTYGYAYDSDYSSDGFYDEIESLIYR